jgi:tetratricopeptide (TPR) repeat protein
MFKHIFSTMHELLEEIVIQYSSATGRKKADLAEQLQMLKSMSDSIVEDWLNFEEKLEQVKHLFAEDPAIAGIPEVPQSESFFSDDQVCQSKQNGSFSKGHGYYLLMMYPEAIRELEQVVRALPDHLLARFFLAMSLLHIGEHEEAYRHFQFIIPLSDDKRMKAIAYNAMGFIQFQHRNVHKAVEMFQLAHQTDPTLEEPIVNLHLCSLRNGHLQLTRGKFANKLQ